MEKKWVWVIFKVQKRIYIWLPASYCKNIACYCFWNEISYNRCILAYIYCLFYSYLSGGHRVQETCMRGKATRLVLAKEHIWKTKVLTRGSKWCVISFKRVSMLSFTRSQCWASHQWTRLGWTDHIHSSAASTHLQIRVKQATMILMENNCVRINMSCNC